MLPGLREAGGSPAYLPLESPLEQGGGCPICIWSLSLGPDYVRGQAVVKEARLLSCWSDHVGLSREGALLSSPSPKAFPAGEGKWSGGGRSFQHDAAFGERSWISLGRSTFLLVA